MPNRMIRDGLLTSWRYERLSSDAKIFLFHVFLCADDLGCIELGPTYLRRRVLFSQDSDERIAKLIAELADVDLLRPYQVNRTYYGFIPRFGQRLQIKYAKYPQPPRELYADDDDALQKFNKINEEIPKSTVGQPLANRWPDDGQRPVSGKREAVSEKEKAKPICAEPAKDRRSALVIGEGDVIQTLPSTKGEVEVRKSWVMELIEAYPAVMVAQEVDRAKLWLEANPTKKKANVRRFLTNWMARTQERGGSK
jgi:hypothetical protein